jgi:hypothetical protein
MVENIKEDIKEFNHVDEIYVVMINNSIIILSLSNIN